MNREQTVIDFFTHLREDNLNSIEQIFTPNGRFKDPFNDVVGVPAIKAVFKHMFETTISPRFIVHHYASNEQKLCMPVLFASNL